MDLLQSTTLIRFFPSPQNPTTTSSFVHPLPLRYLRSTATTSSAPISLTNNNQTHKVFDESPQLAWNTLIHTHLANNNLPLALSTLTQMLHLGFPLDTCTFHRLLHATPHLSILAKQLHTHALKLHLNLHHDNEVSNECQLDPLECDVLTSNLLLKMYIDCDNIKDARLVFDHMPYRDVVSWTSMIRGYVEKGGFFEAFELFRRMNLDNDGSLEPDSVLISTLLPACGGIGSGIHGREVHCYLLRNGMMECDVVMSHSLLKMYIDCDGIRDARSVFEMMDCKDVGLWTLMIRGYVKKGKFSEAFRLFRKMNSDGLKPNPVSIASVLPACARVASHKHGREIHGYLLRNGVEFDLTVKNAVMDMYAKSGAISCAENVFAEMNERDALSWTMMVLGYSLNGQGKHGVDLFRQMEKNSEEHLDDTAYAAALHACSTARMVEEGKVYFNHIMAPTVAHCALKVSLLARCALFDEARIFIRELKIENHPEVLRKLLEGCRIHGEYDLGKQVVEQFCELEPLNAENYVMLLNWYAGSGKWDMVDRLRESMRDKGLKPKKAYTWTLFRKKVHLFGTGDVSHPRSTKIYSALQGFMEKMRTKGLEPKWDFSLHDVDEERECTLVGHSELLALSFGLISSQVGPILLEKNSRVCRGCHDFAKFISKLRRREIILKDPNVFHHFKDGYCTCEDCW